MSRIIHKTNPIFFSFPGRKGWDQRGFVFSFEDGVGIFSHTFYYKNEEDFIKEDGGVLEHIEIPHKDACRVLCNEILWAHQYVRGMKRPQKCFWVATEKDHRLWDPCEFYGFTLGRFEGGKGNWCLAIEQDGTEFGETYNSKKLIWFDVRLGAQIVKKLKGFFRAK